MNNSLTMTTGSLVGAAASFSIILLWLFTFHKKFFISLLYTRKINAYGVYTDFSEALRTHFWFLLRAKLPGYKAPNREALEKEVKETFLTEFLSTDNVKDVSESDKQVLVTHSCRSIFYYIIRTLLEEAEERTGKMKIKMALPAVHFGSFYRLLKGMEKSMHCIIEFYEIDLKEDDWTLDQDSIDEKEISSCDLILCQHLFGLPLNQDRLIDLGKKYSIPVLEDCVQSGSLFGKYHGHPRSDIVMYSGGLDKTPQSFGAGLGYFRNTPAGNHFYNKCLAYHESLPMDTWKARLTACFNQTIHLMIAKNTFNVNNLLGLVAYVWISERGDFIKWYALSLKVRQAKAITPFQHAESGFLRKPTVYQLESILYAITTKKPHYQGIIQRELEARELLLSNIPQQYHSGLFPWLTPQVIQQHKDNRGISEFTWVVSPKGDRMGLCAYLNDHFVVTLINTTWESNEKTTKLVAKDINNNLVYLPNLNQMDDDQIRHTASILTKYCESLEPQKA